MSETSSDSLDFFNSQELNQDPYGYFDHLRGQCPVTQETHHDVFMVTGYDEAIAVYHDQTTFSSCISALGPFASFPVPLVGDNITDIIETYRGTLPFSDQIPSFDPPKHTAQRGLLMRLITPKRLKENEAFLQQLAERQIEQFHQRGECEFIGEYASPYTLLVIADLLGVPEEDHEAFLENLTNHSGVAMSHSPLAYLYEQFTGYIEDRRRVPKDDVMTGLATATFPDGSLPPVDDVMKIASNLFAAGKETTARLLGTMLQILGEQPEIQQQLRANREFIPAFVEETLRMESPIKGTFRLSRTATTVKDSEIPAASTVMVLASAANRDPREFDDPDTLRLDRPNGRQHIAFGHGIHTCAGAPLARAEANVSLQRILDRLGDIRISDEHHGPAGDRHWNYTPTWMLRGHDSLYLDFTPLG